MTRALYYAQNARQDKDFFKYGIIPIAATVGAALFPGDGHKCKVMAATFAGMAYNWLTFSFFGQEAEEFDRNTRAAVLAELGMDDHEFKLSDMWKSQNSIVKTERDDLVKVAGMRLATDAMAYIPLLLSFARKFVPEDKKAWFPYSKESATDYETVGDKRIPFDRFERAAQQRWDAKHPAPPEGASGHLHALHEVSRARSDSFRKALSAFPYAETVYAAKSLYWMYETNQMRESAHFQIVGVRESIGSDNGDMRFDQVFKIFQRARTDRGERMYTHDEKEVVRPLLNKIVDNYNRIDHFDMATIVYLFGLNKVRIHDEKGQVSEEAIRQSEAEIEKLAAIGLEGVREENRHKRIAEGTSHDNSPGFAERVRNTLVNAAYHVLVPNRRQVNSFSSRINESRVQDNSHLMGI